MQQYDSADLWCMSRCFGKKGCQILWLTRRPSVLPTFLLKCVHSLCLEIGEQGRQLPSNLTILLLQPNMAAIIAIGVAHLAVAQQYGAMMEPGQGLAPRFFYNSAQPVKRQSGDCGTGFHQCMSTSSLLLYED
jgi:hypothetical protein